MFHWRTFTWESLGCTQLLVNSLPRSSSCKQNQPKKNKIFSKLSWPRMELNPEMQMAISMLMRLQREAHLPFLFFHHGFHSAKEFFFWSLQGLFPSFPGVWRYLTHRPFPMMPKSHCTVCTCPFIWVSLGQEYFKSGGLVAWKSQKKDSQEHRSKMMH